ncbi:proline--tRNA ligase [Burkholderia sp. Ac-20384]|uniref:Proline--tRNA ligase n=1 Tax=Burkholderia lata (strain ATCC 17760 / DSM 23089 / LMG 22485 / NCIMB 9086 / R18194 / 383) TaxID=482957 RepID=A0A833PSR3_BURL3|nr:MULTISPECIES: proline--tRNA ligase [Burkholderia]KAF1035333.1 MAG: Proline--tRNA ligase [Burkholderia lata]MBN3823319.1 proline--tRNA ligase [Burkholderia sp. Ac-20384]
MRASRFFIQTLKEVPADAEIASHRLMMRAGMIRRLAGGIYHYLPLGLRSLRKIEGIVRDEMNRAGALEVSMPVVQPAELWRESERWNEYGPELLRFKDRKHGDFVLGPTHEEVVTDLVRHQIRSYRQLPLNLYQIQTKFRDEIRPRFGLVRGREFVMKDAYSFDQDLDGLKRSYRNMFDAYHRIFSRMGLTFRAVAADNGSIGGTGSHEFQAITDTGEDRIAYCPTSMYAANVEAAEALSLLPARRAPSEPIRRRATPGLPDCAAVSTHLEIPLERIVKCIVLAVPGATDRAPSIWLLLLRGDHAFNDVKAEKLPMLSGFRIASDAEVRATIGASREHIGPISPAKPVRIMADRTVANMSDFVTGANERGQHFCGVNWGRDLPEPDFVADIREVCAGDPSPDGGGRLEICRGIEVGHVFQLGTRYSDAMRATCLDENGVHLPMMMGCYGIGISRILAAAVEQHYDDRGIVWPHTIAPFEVVLCPIAYHRTAIVREHTDRLYDALIANGIDVIVDDRCERPGAMFADWELIGIPHRLVISERGLSDGRIEYQARHDTVPSSFTSPDHALNALSRMLRKPPSNTAQPNRDLHP